MSKWKDRNEKEVIKELRELNEKVEHLERSETVEQKEIRKDTGLLQEIAARLQPHLGFIKLAFGGNMAQGPVILNEGQTTVATVLYFDLSGVPMPAEFVPLAVSYTVDHPEFASSVPRADGQTDDIDYVAAGVANLTATVTSAEGKVVADTETVTCVSTVPPPPVLGSIKIDFRTPEAIPPPAEPPVAPVGRV